MGSTQHAAGSIRWSTVAIQASLALGTWLYGSSLAQAADSDTALDDEFTDLSLEELLDLPLLPTSFVASDIRDVPATVTQIDQDLIWKTSAHNLDELLEIHTPGYYVTYHHWEGAHIGMRGITFDRDDRALMVVNGRTMNLRMHGGAVTERTTPLMGDLHTVNVVRGPGAASYGAEAMAEGGNKPQFTIRQSSCGQRSRLDQRQRARDGRIRSQPDL
ncbi:MAG: Plug domain-containing protein [Planctomycetota bacterium]|nr:Plug domain-containing protein [Planctomycetota bacterium]